MSLWRAVRSNALRVIVLAVRWPTFRSATRPEMSAANANGSFDISWLDGKG
jgi:hypothetical protein